MLYVPNESKEEAEKLTKYLIENKYVACSHILPVGCYCMWDSIVKDETEIISIFKSRSENWNFLKKEIEKVHSYNCPCIIKIDVECNEGYEKWVYDETINC